MCSSRPASLLDADRGQDHAASGAPHPGATRPVALVDQQSWTKRLALLTRARAHLVVPLEQRIDERHEDRPAYVRCTYRPQHGVAQPTGDSQMRGAVDKWRSMKAATCPSRRSTSPSWQSPSVSCRGRLAVASRMAGASRSSLRARAGSARRSRGLIVRSQAARQLKSSRTTAHGQRVTVGMSGAPAGVVHHANASSSLPRMTVSCPGVDLTRTTQRSMTMGPRTTRSTDGRRRCDVPVATRRDAAVVEHAGPLGDSSVVGTDRLCLARRHSAEGHEGGIEHTAVGDSNDRLSATGLRDPMQTCDRIGKPVGEILAAGHIGRFGPNRSHILS